jgi:hypothetical protein
VVAAGSESPGGQAVLPLLDYVSATSVYLQGIDVEEIIGTIHAAPDGSVSFKVHGHVNGVIGQGCKIGVGS